ncbi:MAG: hypothetical protein M1819_006161 [Sarea resinae]|nr:MAG: hypothetical protein M1819_006161 [Sarea resinae]
MARTKTKGPGRKKKQSQQEVAAGSGSAKPVLLDEGSSDGDQSDSENGGVALNGQAAGDEEPAFKINEEYARRFEHNKKREEMQRCKYPIHKHLSLNVHTNPVSNLVEEKYGKATVPKKRKASGDDGGQTSESGGSSSDSETEDDEGFLATEALDAEISATLQAIRSKDPRVYNKDITFYTPIDEEAASGTPNGEKKEKPMFLRDYHRKNLLEGRVGDEDVEDGTPRTYAQEQDDLKRTIVKEMHAAAESESKGSADEGDDNDDDEEEDGGFLIPKGKPALQEDELSKKAMKKAIELDVEAAEKDPENFLSNFMAARAWTNTSGTQLKPFESDDEDEDKRAEEFEQAYNFRFEDPATANEKLMSHARDAAVKYSVRREEQNPRKKAREAQREKKEAEKREREQEKARLKKLKVEEMEERVKKIKEAAGLSGKSIRQEDWLQFLEEGWDDDKWEEEMNRKFGDAYYAEAEGLAEGSEQEEGSEKHKKPKKPKWDDEIDIADLVPEFEDDESNKKPAFTLSDDEQDQGGPEANDSESDIDMDGGEPGAKKPKTKKDRLQERNEKKRAARVQRRKIEQLVEEKMDLDNTLASSSSKRQGQFRYRETSPSSYGLTARDILLASDTQLNQYAGLKKLAAFRDPEKKRKDKKKLGKKARLRQWRKETFGNPDGPQKELRDVIAAEVGMEIPKNSSSGADVANGEPRKKRRKRSGKEKGKAETTAAEA